MPCPQFIRNASVQNVQFAALSHLFGGDRRQVRIRARCKLSSCIGARRRGALYVALCVGFRSAKFGESFTFMHVRTLMLFRCNLKTRYGRAVGTWEKTLLTKIPELTKEEREKLPSPLPNDPEDGDIWRSEKGRPGWVLSWKYQPSKRGAPRSTCQKAPFWCYKPVLYKKLVEKFESASAAAGTAASGTAGAGGTAASGTGAAASPTGSSAGAGECSNGGSLDLETFSEGSLPPADGAVGSTAASAARAAASAASAAMDAVTLYNQLRQENKLPRRRDATEHGPKKRHPGKYYFIKGMPDDGFELVIESKNINRLCPRGWTRPPNIYRWNREPSA